MSVNNHIIDNDRNENDNFDKKRQKTYDYNKSLRQPHNMICLENAKIHTTWGPMLDFGSYLYISNMTSSLYKAWFCHDFAKFLGMRSSEAQLYL